MAKVTPLALDELERCYGVPRTKYQALEAEGVATIAIQLRFSDDTVSARSVAASTGVSSLKLALHLEGLAPPPKATVLQFACCDLPENSSLEEQGVMDGAVLEVHQRAFAPVQVQLATRVGEHQVDLWPHEPLEMALSRVLHELQMPPLDTPYYFACREPSPSEVSEQQATGRTSQDEAGQQGSGDVPPGQVAGGDETAAREWLLDMTRCVEDCGIKNYDSIVPDFQLGTKVIRLQPCEITMSAEPIHPLHHAPEAHHGDYPGWSTLTTAVQNNNVELLEAEVAKADFDVNWRPNGGCCTAISGKCNDGNQV